MDISLSTVNSLATAFGALLDGGTVEFYDGTVPATADTPISGNNLLATLTLENPAFGAASNGTITLIDTVAVQATLSGTCTFARWKTSGSAVVMDTTVGTSGTDLTMTDNVFVSGNNIDFATFTYQQPSS